MNYDGPAMADRIFKLERERDACMKSHVALDEENGRLRERLAEARRLLDEALGYVPEGLAGQIHRALSADKGEDVCPDCHGVGGVTPNGVRFCNCPTESETPSG